GDWAQIEATGGNSVIAAASSVEYIVIGEGGCAAVPYHDGEKIRFAIAYAGENGIKSGVKYSVNDAGEFVEVE
ncbi:hypothetical protein ABRZ24_21525, partial [Brenneria populi]|nr:hypothetical protein [Brenneria populi Li et al. 2015]